MCVRVCVCVRARVRTQSPAFDLSFSGILLLISTVYTYMCESGGHQRSESFGCVSELSTPNYMVSLANRSRSMFTHLSVARPYRQGTLAKPIGVAMETLLFTACAQVKC